MVLRRRVFPFVCLVIAVIFMSSCASSLSSVWKNENFKGAAFKKILVVGLAEIELNRIFYENTFKEHFARKGVTSISSYTVTPAGKVDRKLLEQKAKELGVDAVIVSRIDRLGQYEANVKSARTGDLRYSELKSIYGESTYDQVLPFWPSGFFSTTDRVEIVLETSLYESAEGRLVWSAHSKITITERPYDEIESFVKNIVTRMADDRVI